MIILVAANAHGFHYQHPSHSKHKSKQCNTTGCHAAHHLRRTRTLNGRIATRRRGRARDATTTHHRRRTGRRRRRTHRRRDRAIRSGGHVLAKAHSERGIGDQGLFDLVVGGTGSLGREGAVVSDADGLELGALLGDDGCGGSAAVVEELGERRCDNGDIFFGDAEGGGGCADLRDEVAHFVGVEGHESGR